MILFISPKTSYITKRLPEEAAKAKVYVETFSIQELADKGFDVDITKYDCLYIRFCYPYFEQTTDLAKKFIGAGKKVVDAAIAQGDVGQGKMNAYEKLARANIAIPKTVRFLEAKQWKYPCIVKWDYGFGGKEVFLVKGFDQLRKTTELLPAAELLLQEFIPAEYEYKIITVGYKALPVVLRFEIDQNNWRPDFTQFSVIPSASEESLTVSIIDRGSLHSASNALGLGRDDKIQKLVSLAEQSSRLLKCELAKVDILQKGDKFYVLEVNRWPGLKSFEELTGYNAVLQFLEYLIMK